MLDELLIIDKQPITCEGIKSIASRLNIFENINIVEIGNLVDYMKRTTNNVIVIDYTSVDISAERLLILQERYHNNHFVLFSDNLSEEFIRRMVYSDGKFSVAMKDSSLYEIETALLKACEGKQYICRRILSLLKQNSDRVNNIVSPLTSTEREILRLIALGKTTKDIASERHLSVYTVMTHRKNIFRKIEVNNIYEATKYALRAGIIDSVEYYI